MKPNETNASKVGCGDLRSERGSAIILTLGVLALLLITATVFIFTANTDREAAAVAADIAKARLMAKAKMEQAMALVYYAGKNKQMSGYFTYGTDNWTGHYHMVSSWNGIYSDDLGDAFHVDLGFDYTPAGVAGDLATGLRSGPLLGDPSWQLIKNSSDELIGRAAYLVLAEPEIDPYATTGMAYADIDPAAGYQSASDVVVDYRDISTANYMPLGSGTMETMKGNTAVRIGRSVAEIYTGDRIYLAAPLAGGLGSDSFREFVDNIPPFTSVVPASVQNRWLSWQQMYRTCNLSPAFLSTHARGFAGRTTYTRQAFEDGGAYQRFSLDAADWDGATGTPITAAGLLGAAAAWPGTASAVPANVTTTAIPWLGQILSGTDLDGGGIGASDHVIIRNQIAANLIDYNDLDDVATSDLNVGVSPYTVSYAGLEKVPYINELYITATVDGSNVLDINASCELVNIFGDNLDGNNVRIDVGFDIDDTGGTTHTQKYYHNASSGGTTIVNGHTYLKYDNSGTTFSGYELNADTLLRVTRIAAYMYTTNSLTVDTIRDAVYISTAKKSAAANLLYNVSRTYGTYASVTDPRANTQEAFWTWAANFASGTSGTTEAANAGSDPYANPDDETSADYGLRDIEQVDDPKNGVSTAFIRNAPMQSLWELGAIHRGEPWKTLNLISTVNNPGGSYSDGDAKLLDQCSIERASMAPGKIDANSANLNSWYALLRRIYMGTDYDNNGGSEIGSSRLQRESVRSSDMITNILATNGADGGTPLAGRWQIGKATSLHLDDWAASTPFLTDQQREELTGKIANLLTVENGQRYRIIVCAQAVKDLGEAPSLIPSSDRSPNWVEYSAAQNLWCDILAEQRIMVIVHRDPETGKMKIEQIKTLDL